MAETVTPLGLRGIYIYYMRLHFLKLDREFFCLQPSLARLYSAAASPSERRRSDGSLAINVNCLVYLIVSTYDDNWINPVLKFKKLFVFLTA